MDFPLPCQLGCLKNIIFFLIPYFFYCFPQNRAQTLLLLYSISLSKINSNCKYVPSCLNCPVLFNCLERWFVMALWILYLKYSKILWQIFNFSIVDYLLGSGINVKNKQRERRRKVNEAEIFYCFNCKFLKISNQNWQSRAGTVHRSKVWKVNSPKIVFLLFLLPPSLPFLSCH